MLDDPGGTVHASTSYHRTVTGDTAPIQGCSELEVGVGMPHEMWVANITDECILGLDFLNKYDCQVCLKESILVVDEEEIPLTTPTASAMRCCQVIAKESCVVAPWAEAIIPGQLTSKGEIADGDWWEMMRYSRWGVYWLEDVLSI